MNLCKTIDREGVNLSASHRPPVWMQRANRACFGISTVLALFCFSFPWLTPSVFDSERGAIHVRRTFLPSKDPYFDSRKDWWTSAPWPGYGIPAEFWILAALLTAYVAGTAFAQRKRPVYEPAILIGLSLIVLSSFAGSAGAASVALYRHSEFARHAGYDLCLTLGVCGCLSILVGLVRIAWLQHRLGATLGLCTMLISMQTMWYVHSRAVAPQIAQPITKFVVQDLPITPVQETGWCDHRFDLLRWRIEIQGDEDVSRTFINGVELDEAELEARIATASEDDAHHAIIRASGSLNMSEVFAVTDLLVASGARGVRFETCVRPGIAAGGLTTYLIDPKIEEVRTSRVEIRETTIDRSSLDRDGVPFTPADELVLWSSERWHVTVAVDPDAKWQFVATILDQLTMSGASSTLERLRERPLTRD